MRILSRRAFFLLIKYAKMTIMNLHRIDVLIKVRFGKIRSILNRRICTYMLGNFFAHQSAEQVRIHIDHVDQNEEIFLPAFFYCMLIL